MDNSILGLIIFSILILVVVGLAFLNSGSNNRSRNTTPRVIVVAPPVTPPAAPPAIQMSIRNVNNMTNSGVDMDEALANGCEFTEEITPWSYVHRIKQPRFHAPVHNFSDNRVVYNQAANGGNQAQNQNQPNQPRQNQPNQNQPNQPNQGNGNQNQPNNGGNQGNRRGQQGQGGNGP